MKSCCSRRRIGAIVAIVLVVLSITLITGLVAWIRRERAVVQTLLHDPVAPIDSVQMRRLHDRILDGRLGLQVLNCTAAAQQEAIISASLTRYEVLNDPFPFRAILGCWRFHGEFKALPERIAERVHAGRPGSWHALAELRLVGHSLVFDAATVDTVVRSSPDVGLLIEFIVYADLTAMRPHRASYLAFLNRNDVSDELKRGFLDKIGDSGLMASWFPPDDPEVASFLVNCPEWVRADVTQQR